MSDKQRKTFTLQPENAELCDELNNASAVVDELLSQYRKGKNKQTVAVELQISQKQRELDEAEDNVERLRNDIEELKQLRREFQSQENAELAKAREALDGVPRDENNPAVKNWAEQLGMTPTELLQQIE